MNAKTRRMAILVRILSTYFLEYIFYFLVTLSMMRPLKYHLLRLSRLKKPGGKHPHSHNNGGIKYGIIIPSNASEAAQFDKENGNFLWGNAILKELEALMSMKLF